jgi:hypothetical protein
MMKIDSNVVVLGGKEAADAKRKQDLLDVIDAMRMMVQSGEITEFVAASMDSDGLTQIHACAFDLPGGVGLFEIGKHLLIAGETGIVEME